MCQSILGDASLWRRLLALDERIAADERAGGCRHCGAALHSARYPRKPFGVGRAVLGACCDSRLSFCCASEGCRRRSTPASVRFLGRKAYLGMFVLLVCALSHGVSARGRTRLAEQFNVSERTLERWRDWWRATLPSTPWWRTARAQFSPAVDDTALPASVLGCFGEANDTEALIATLTFIAPCSRTSFAEPCEHAR